MFLLLEVKEIWKLSYLTVYDRLWFTTFCGEYSHLFNEF
jgi:hypothetical protein